MRYVIPFRMCKQCKCYTKHVADVDTQDNPYVECHRCKCVEIIKGKKEK